MGLGHDPRDRESLRHRYEVERVLARRLMDAPAGERPGLYRAVYDELYRTVEDHPQNTRKKDPARQAMVTEFQLRLLAHFLQPDSVYLEVGPGDCHLALEVAGRVRRVYAVDVSEILPREVARPDNFSLILTDGTTIDVPEESVDVAYSNQLMEHLHPDDAAAQLQQICRAVKPGGKYVCVTPHRFSGPHDISGDFFCERAEGFHLKEYSWRELKRLFLDAGFASVEMWVGPKSKWVKVPEAALLAAEASLSVLPHAVRRRLATTLPLRIGFINIVIVGWK